MRRAWRRRLQKWRGRTPVVPGTGKRFGCNMISTVTKQGQLSFMIFRERFTARVFIRFAQRLLRQPYLNGRKCFLIVDRHPVHKSAAVQHWLGQRPEQIEMFLLPGYSPELNPDELLNQDVKSNALGRQRPEDQQQMMHLARTYLWNTQRQPEAVRSYFQEQHVRYGADPETSNCYCSRKHVGLRPVRRGPHRSEQDRAAGG